MESRAELAHYGVRGMKWGIRRFQNEDGTLTSVGKQRYQAGNTRGGSIERHQAADTHGGAAKPHVKKQYTKAEIEQYEKILDALGRRKAGERPVSREKYITGEAKEGSMKRGRRYHKWTELNDPNTIISNGDMGGGADAWTPLSDEELSDYEKLLDLYFQYGGTALSEDDAFQLAQYWQRFERQKYVMPGSDYDAMCDKVAGTLIAETHEPKKGESTWMSEEDMQKLIESGKNSVGEFYPLNERHKGPKTRTDVTK